MDAGHLGKSDGLAFLISAYGVYEIIAAACSSPQTAEINAHSRAGTLMKWVHLGLGQAVILTSIGAAIDKKHRKPIVAGATLAAAMMYGSYLYAKAAGLKSAEPGTEDTGWSAGRWARR